ncbi:MAG: phage major capsid protein [Oscillospiraceae bacterium]|nr:phage major capsid protein [Oscillospiraceae bacterium]
MFNSIKIEKGLYNLSGKSFSQALEALDPSENYTDGLAKLDAFERQLKRFDIKVKGVNADKVDKFFQSAESALLFPEFVRRAVESGLNSGCVNKITAAMSIADGIDCRGIVLSDGETAYDAEIAVGGALPESSISLTSAPIALKKFARLINAPYEAIRQQRLDVFAVALRAVGAKLAKAIETAAITAVTATAEEVAMTGGDFNYSELAAFWGKFTSCEMNAIVCSPATAAKILAFDEMNKAVTTNGGNMITPFGAEIVVSSAVADDIAIGMDKTSALELIRGGEVVVEVDKLISKLSEAAAVAVNAGFSVISADAVKVLNIA